MATIHINANPGDFANVVLMPGDPVRAKFIAENYLVDYKEVANIRGMLGFTGHTRNGKKISVMASGMGMPSIGIYSHELFTSHGVDTIIRVGTCGSYQPEINLFDILIASTSSTDSNWMSQFKLNGTFSAGADCELAFIAREQALRLNIPFHMGNILSADVFYDSDPESWKRWAALGVMGVEMESYALYVNAARLHKRALCLLTVTDSFVNRTQKATTEERVVGLKKMLDIAIATAESVAK